MSKASVKSDFSGWGRMAFFQAKETPTSVRKIKDPLRRRKNRLIPNLFLSFPFVFFLYLFQCVVGTGCDHERLLGEARDRGNLRVVGLPHLSSQLPLFQVPDGEMTGTAGTHHDGLTVRAKGQARHWTAILAVGKKKESTIQKHSDISGGSAAALLRHF